MNSSIEVNGIRVYGYHGCMEEEAMIGTWFEADVAVDYNFTESALTDDLSKTIDYVAIREIAEKNILKRSDLIETVIKGIADELKTSFSEITGLRITLRKYNPPINGDVNHVAVKWEESL